MQQWKAAAWGTHTGISGSAKFLFKKYLKCDFPENKA